MDGWMEKLGRPISHPSFGFLFPFVPSGRHDRIRGSPDQATPPRAGHLRAPCALYATRSIQARVSPGYGVPSVLQVAVLPPCMHDAADGNRGIIVEWSGVGVDDEELKEEGGRPGRGEMK